jgi:hypothetical protein
MARDYIRPDVPGKVLSEAISANSRILIAPTWDELCAFLQEIQEGCRINRIPESQLKQLYEQTRRADFFSAYIMTAEKAPAHYGFPYPSTQAAAVRLDDVIGFLVRRVNTAEDHYVDYPIYPLAPKDKEFDYKEWADSIGRICWPRLTDEEIDRLQMRSVVEEITGKHHEEVEVAQKKRAKEHKKFLKEIKRRPLSPEQLARRRQKRAGVIQEELRQKREANERDRVEMQARKAKEEEARRASFRLKREQEKKARLEREQYCRPLIARLTKGHKPVFCSLWQDAYAGIDASLRAEGKAHVTWKEFQARWPSLANTYRRRLVPKIRQGVIQLADLADAAPAPAFTLSLDVWEKYQCLFDAPQLVFQINSEYLYTCFAMENIETRMAVNEALLNMRPGHPVHEWTVGWLRVHVDDANRVAFVDEVQSDALETIIESYNPNKQLRRDLERQLGYQQVFQQRGNPFTYLPSQRRGSPVGRKKPQIKLVNKSDARRVERVLASWNLHGFATVQHWAHAIGFRAAMHSRDSAQQKPGMSPSKRKWNTYYAPIIKQFKLTAESVPGYPAPIMVEKK